ncbi:heavy-metal-associated domain-containing protein [Amycolatopsis sp. K13G38]|uniref:Heavy-metal-associated domain-containing protein n=1 Tax=Amycolatopsis acididurans TaxID=2724524 RepID=A0ABX1J2V0_9PSEU|nr:heavy-metal-associated domain-containing protein [Amycolatopsis acididurans]NKQ53959.1 heavy-metal-associated domain-containing protein [Amycolatopsis acididurans]
MPTKSVYTVRGMSCGHCASSVTEQMTALGGVQKVDIDVASGQVVVTSQAPLALEQVSAAVTEAGFSLEPR